MGVTERLRTRFLGTPPAWLTWAVLGALVAVYTGERIFGAGLPRLVLSGAGMLFLVGAALWRGGSWLRTTGDARSVERLFFLAYGGLVLSLALFFLAGDGAGWLGLTPGDPAAAARFRTIATVLACVLLSASLLPALAAQWAAGPGYSAGGPTAGVDRLRITQLALAGLTIGLAAPLLMIAGWLARENNETLDLSYFRVSSPGTASQQIAQSLGEELRVLLFFPPTNEVKDQLRDYFRALGSAAANVRVEEHDLLASPAVAQQFGVVRDGTIVIAAGQRAEFVSLPTQLRQARLRLRNLDQDVQQALNRVAREQRTVYMTVGHGELNDGGGTRGADTLSLGTTLALQSLLGYLNYDYRELGLGSGLANEVPADAALVMVLGPNRPFLAAELQTLDRYLARGGALLLALEPESGFEMGPLRERLGLDFRGTSLADEQRHIPLRGNISDRRFIVTNVVYSHESIPTVSHSNMGDALAFIGAGYLEPLEVEKPRVSVVIRSMPTTFADQTIDFALGAGEEQMQYPLVAAVEEATEPAAGTIEWGEMRALVFADSDLFADEILYRLRLNEALVTDAVRWLGREEELAGTTSSESDIPIVHTRAENIAWFYSTILGAPVLVLLAGFLAARRRRLRYTVSEA